MFNQNSPSVIQDIFRLVGGDGLGRSVASLGNATRNIPDIVGVANQGAFLVALAQGPLSNAVSTQGNGSFTTFVQNTGSAQAASTVRNALGTSAIGLPNTVAMTGTLTNVFGPSIPTELAIGDTKKFCDTRIPNAFTETPDTHVPVKDFTLHNINRSIANDASTIAKLLQDLCQKEFVLDPKAQHEWVQVSENLVRSTVEFVNKAYNGNPLYLRNPYQYFDLVKRSVVDNFLSEIEANQNIDVDIAREITKTIKETLTGREWNTVVKRSVTQVEASKFRESFEEGGGWETYRKLFLDPQNSQSLFSLALTELNNRLEETRSYEEQKVFLLELCASSIAKRVQIRGRLSSHSFVLRTCLPCLYYFLSFIGSLLIVIGTAPIIIGRVLGVW